MQTSIDRLNNNFAIKVYNNESEIDKLKKITQTAFNKIAPTWPLKNIIAVNPLTGFENKPFAEALSDSMRYFKQPIVPEVLLQINRQTIKWCQSFFDEGQATINMPFRNQGFYKCFKQLAQYDNQLKPYAINKQNFFNTMPETPDHAIHYYLKKMRIVESSYEEFLSLMLTTLPGWASYICYQTEWLDAKNRAFPITQLDYLAVRIALTYLLCPDGFNYARWIYAIQSPSITTDSQPIMKAITENESKYQDQLMKKLTNSKHNKKGCDVFPDAQLVFCIDVRSEPLRRAIESQGQYETFGFAGFFGVPVAIKQPLSKIFEASCPALVTPKHAVKEKLCCDSSTKNKIMRKKRLIDSIKQVYGMLKYTFVTPFTLVETIGWCSGISMLMRTIAPQTATKLKKLIGTPCSEKLSIEPNLNTVDELSGIKFDDQCRYAEDFLCISGFTKNFSPIVVLCGHGASTQNNAYHSALDCGACGGRNGAANARILATILNDERVRHKLAEKQIHIPKATTFIAAIHDTTTDAITFFNDSILKSSSIYNKLKYDLATAIKINNKNRLAKLFPKKNNISSISVKKLASDWAQTRPEWGLARNASMIIAPRSLTKEIDLDGRAFLHSYDWEADHDASYLTAILTAPMVVAQWINCQYLFSTIDNVTFGSGSKITHNICGKIGIMQGNASDLMPGLPLQSVNTSDHESYHEPLRLLTVVMAPRDRIKIVIDNESVLQRLFGNAWVRLVCLDPTDLQLYSLTSAFDWQNI